MVWKWINKKQLDLKAAVFLGGEDQERRSFHLLRKRLQSCHNCPR
ncbi:hypothetical protein [Halobacillus litoralis]|nr:hypothetical protein [Halobacillus litoralis]